MTKCNYKISCLLIIFVVMFNAVVTNNAFGKDLHVQFDSVLQKYVSNGLVNYKQLKNNRANLDGYLQVLESISQSDFDTWSRDEQLAYLINTYNAATLRLIIDNYPVSSIKKIGAFRSPWDIKSVVLFGEVISLNKLEHDIIRKKYDEPRIHVALVCAARGCPILRNDSYRAKNLDVQLDEQMYLFFEDINKNRINTQEKTVYLSPIFKWYKNDFIKEQNLLEYLQKYWKKPLPIDYLQYKVKFTHYDWSLNEG